MSRCQALLLRNPRSVVLLSLAGSAAFGLGRYAEAESYLRRALEIQPDSQVLKDSLERIRKRL